MGIKLLDCTLRDGGRGFGNTWGDDLIMRISSQLAESGIDIIEVGFLWYIADGVFRMNSTLFRSMEEIEPFLYEPASYVVYIEYALFKKGNYNIPPKNRKGIKGIRLGVSREEFDEAYPTMIEIKKKGYDLYIQGINCLDYSKEELRIYFEKMNDIEPYAAAIVDTYGAMTEDKLKEIIHMADTCLKSGIAIDFHSHNNKGLSGIFAASLAEYFYNSSRELILDCTLMGIGMGAGNLSTEHVWELLRKDGEGYRRLKKISGEIASRLTGKFRWQWDSLTARLAERWIPSLTLSHILNYYRKIGEDDRELFYFMCPISGAVEKIDETYRMLIEDNEAERLCQKENLAYLADVFKGRRIVIIGGGATVKEAGERIKDKMGKNALYMLMNGHYRRLFEGCGEIWSFCTQQKEIPGKKICMTGSADGNTEIRINLRDICVKPELIIHDAIILFLNLCLTLHERFNTKMELYIAGFDGIGVPKKQRELFSSILDEASSKIYIKFLTNSDYVRSEND